MDTLSFLLDGFAGALQPQNLFFALLGAFLGTFIGALPGLGPTATISLLLPISFTLPTTAALIMLCGIYLGAMYGGSITAVLLDIPGEVSSVMTAVDGHELHKRGRGGAALGIAAVGSFFAGTVSVVLLVFLAPQLSRVGLEFGPPEYFALAMLGLATVSGLVGRDPLKGYSMMLLGLGVATIGPDPITSVPRFTFDSYVLADGVGFLPVAIGLFGFAAVLATINVTAPGSFGESTKFRLRSLLPTKAEWKESAAPIVRGSGIGFTAGLLPGTGSGVASFLAYGLEHKLSKRPERFGKGAIEGLASAEASNNGSTGGAMLPMLTLGIPGSATTAVLLSAFLAMGLSPGPNLLSQSQDVVWPLIASLYVANVMLLVLNSAFIPFFVWLVRGARNILNPTIILLCFVGAFADSFNLFPMWVTLLFGALGFIMHVHGYPVAPMVLGLVLGPLAEQTLRQSMVLSHGDVTYLATSSWISGGLLALTLLIVLSPLAGRFLRGRKQSPKDSGEKGSGERDRGERNGDTEDGAPVTNPVVTRVGQDEK